MESWPGGRKAIRPSSAVPYASTAAMPRAATHSRSEGGKAAPVTTARVSAEASTPAASHASSRIFRKSGVPA